MVLQHGDYGLAAAGAIPARSTCRRGSGPRRARGLARPGRALRARPDLGIAMGALPFDGSCDAILRLPERVIRGPPLHGEVAPQPGWAITALVPDPLPVEYEAAVERALAAIDAGEVDKVVLARTLLVEADAPIDPRLRRAALQRRGARVASCFSSRSPEASSTWSAPRRNSSSGAGAEGVQRSPGRDRSPVAGSRRETRRSPGNCSTPSRSSASTAWSCRGGRGRDGAVLLEPRRRQ